MHFTVTKRLKAIGRTEPEFRCGTFVSQADGSWNPTPSFRFSEQKSN